MKKVWKARATRTQEQAARARTSRAAAALAARRPAPRRQPLGELKTLQAAQALAADTTGAILLLNGIARGEDYNQREGRQIFMKHMELRIQNAVTGGTGVDQHHRYLLVLDSQPNGGALTITNVLESVSTLAYPNLDYRQRFRILLDKTVVLNATAEPFSHTFEKHFLRLNIPVTFNNGNTGTIADIATNSLYFIALGTQAAGVTAGSCTVTSRIRFTDK